MPLNIKEFGDNILLEAASRVSKELKKINNTQQLIANGKAVLAESDSRLREFYDRQKKLREEKNFDIFGEFNGADQKSEVGFERKIGLTNDILSIEFFEIGLLAAKSVGLLRLFGSEFGTGFHVGHQVIMTNHHVVKDRVEAGNCEFELNVEENRFGKAKNIYTYYLDPNRFYLANKELDFALIAVSNPNNSNPPLDHFGWHVLLDIQGKIRIGDPVNIIQHPNGNDKAIVVHNSNLLHLENGTDIDKYCYYSGDTEEGSSGSPVFNSRWEIVALHHKAVPKTDHNGNIVDSNGQAMSEKRYKENPEDIAYEANEGIRVSRLVQAIKDSAINDPTQKKIRDDLIKLWNEPAAHKLGLKAAEVKM
jgi:endonuclease G